MLTLIRRLFFVFLVILLICIGRGYGLAEDETGDPGGNPDYTQVTTEQAAGEDLNAPQGEESPQEVPQDLPSDADSSINMQQGQGEIIEEVQPADPNAPKKISLDIKGMDIVDVLKLLANQGRLNIVTGKNVTGRVSMFLKDVGVWDAFEIIIATNGLAYEKKGDIINVMSARDYEATHGKKYDDRKMLVTKKLQYAAANDVKQTLEQIKSNLGKVVVDESSNTIILLDVPEQIQEMEKIISETDIPFELKTKVFDLKYAKPEKLKEQLQEVLTKDVGVLKTDERTNKIIVIDYPSKISQIEQMVEAFDEKTKQVLIEAKIIQVTLTDTYKMGIDWKVIASKQLNLTAFNINRSLSTSGAQIIDGVSTPTSTEDFKIIMDMLKTFGDVRTLSTPRIMVTDGQEAKILVGSKKAYVTDTITQTNSGTNTAEQVQFVDVGVKLYVTPNINKDGFITMKIRPEVSSATSNYTTAQGNTVPIVDTSEAETSVLAKDGVTVVMGGLMKNEKTKNTYKLPLIGEIPFLGALFRRTEDETIKTELVIFLTPHIISGAESMFEDNKKAD